MSDETPKIWLCYARDNLQTARLTLKSGLLNPSLHNAQQATEKALKAVRIAQGVPFRKTHCIADLVEDLAAIGIEVPLYEQECAVMDSIYLPSRYPTDSVLPDGMPNTKIAEDCIDIAAKIFDWAAQQLDAE